MNIKILEVLIDFSQKRKGTSGSLTSILTQPTELI